MAVCRLCNDNLPVKNRRTIFTDTFGVFSQLVEILSYVPCDSDGLSKYVCGFCFSKLNKLSKIEFDIMHKVEALKIEKTSLIKSLREKHLRSKGKSPPKQLSAPTPTPRTPQHQDSGLSGKRSAFKHSPTPRKCKKPLLFTPKKTTSTQVHERAILPKGNIPETSKGPDPQLKAKRPSVRLFSPSKVKVLYVYM